MGKQYIGEPVYRYEVTVHTSTYRQPSVYRNVKSYAFKHGFLGIRTAKDESIFLPTPYITFVRVNRRRVDDVKRDPVPSEGTAD